MKLLRKNYILLTIALLLAILLFANFITIKKIENRILHLVNTELNTPMVKYKLRCELTDEKPNLLFFNYKKQFKNCKIYYTDITGGEYNYKSYHIIPELDISYQLLKQHYDMEFNQISKINQDNLIDNYIFDFENPVYFEISHDDSQITKVKMENNGAISLTHSSGLTIADIANKGLYFDYEDDENTRVFDVELAFDFTLTPEFMEFTKKHNKKLAAELFSKNQLLFKFAIIFDRFNEEEQEELKKRNPSKYKNEKDFFKSMTYDIDSMKFISSHFKADVFGKIVKTAKPGAPEIDLNINMDNATGFLNYSVESIQNAFHNKGKMDLYDTVQPNIVIEALLLTLQELEIIQNGNIELHIKNDAVGGLSIANVNFFTFQQKLMTNFIKLKLENKAK